jgi:RNA polymerase sigma factor (sigma-70 family)
LKQKRSLSDIIEGCRKGQENAMKAFYEHFQGYALAICMSYAADREEALEMMNDGYMKAFKGLHKLENTDYLKSWLRKIMVNTAIDYHRKNIHYQTTELSEYVPEPYLGQDSVYSSLSVEDIMKAVQTLPTTYRVVFVLYVIEGFSHKEIGQQLSIAESTSRANLSIANAMLRKLLSKTHTEYGYVER